MPVSDVGGSLTGEAVFVRKVLMPKHKAATDKGVKIVASCGMDSVPADICAWLAARELSATYKQCSGGVKVVVTDIAGAPSGGTLATAMATFE